MQDFGRTLYFDALACSILWSCATAMFVVQSGQSLMHWPSRRKLRKFALPSD